MKAPTPHNSIAIDSSDSDREMDCDADSVASVEALDEAQHIRLDTQVWDSFPFATVFVTVVWVVPCIASDFGVFICCFVFLWPKF